MRENRVIHLEKNVDIKDPIMIVGLPGVGHVGKLVAEHLVEELTSIKLIEIYSPHFPPQILVDENSEIRMVNNEIYVCKAENMIFLYLLATIKVILPMDITNSVGCILISLKRWE